MAQSAIASTPMSDQSAAKATKSTSSRNLDAVLKASAVLWVIWGLAHIAFGALGLNGFMAGEAAETMKAMAGGADPASLEVSYPPAVVALLNQHSWNLLWFGLFTALGGVMIWRRSAVAVVMTAIVGGAADAGYFVFVDLGGFAAPPGPQMTWISATAIVLSLFVYFRSDRLKSLSP